MTTYILAPGDRLSLLAKRFGIEREAIERSNPALRPDAMNVGEVIVLPLPAAVTLPSAETCKEVRRGLRGPGRVALTFDAGADVGALHDLLAVLQQHTVRCTFFVTGRWVSRHPSALKRIADAGHEVFGHTFTHRSLPPLSNEEILEELERTSQIIHQTIGHGARPYFRPAYGDRDQRVLHVADRAGWQCIYWTLDSYDAVGSPKTPEQIVARVLSPQTVTDPRRSLDGSIILFHASKPSTAKAMELLIPGLRYLGLEPAALTTLLRPPESTDFERGFRH